MNYRNHRKIVVIDGRIGFVGGFNVGREYLGLDEKFGYWRDTHLCIEGAAVTSLAVRFVLDWNYAAKENLFFKRFSFLRSRSMYAEGMTRCRSFPVDRTLRQRRFMIIISD